MNYRLNNIKSSVKKAIKDNKRQGNIKRTAGKAHALPAAIAQGYFKILCMQRLFFHYLHALAALLAAKRQVGNRRGDED